MYMEHANVVLHLDLTCLREYEIRTLHDIHLLSAPRIHPLPNSLGPRLLRTTGPLSLPLPISFTLLRLPAFHIYSTCSLASVDCSVFSHCMKSQRGGGLYFQAELELTY